MKNGLFLAPQKCIVFITFAIFAIFAVIGALVAALTNGIPLPLGVVGHEGSTVIVVLNGLRLLRTNDGMTAERRDGE